MPGAGSVVVGPGVLPLSVDDPGAKVTRSSRALVTADKGNGPQCVRSNAYMGAGPAVHRLAPYQLDREAAGEMNIEDIEVLRRHRASARSEHWATALSRDGRRVLDRALPNDEERLRALYKKLADHGSMLVVVDQPVTTRGPGRSGGSGHGHHRGACSMVCVSPSVGRTDTDDCY